MTWKEEIKKEINDSENYNLIAISEAIEVAMWTNKRIRNSTSSEISKADRNALESSSHTLNMAKNRVEKMMRLPPKEPITETRADPEYKEPR